jgi:hypothetical protein
VRFRSALIATLTALVAVAVGAQAAPGADEPGSSGTQFPAPGQLERVPDAGLTVPKGATRLRTGGSRIHNGNDDIANAAGVQNIINCSKSAYPNYCGFSDDNVGATLESGEPDNCPEPGGPAFDGTVWYVFQVGHRGILDVVLQNTQPDSPTPFLAAFEIFNANTGQGFCGVASDVTTNFGDSFDVGPGSTLGTTVLMAVGARLSGTAGGTYDMLLRLDEDSDDDGVRNSGDDCDTTPGGANGIRGCPDGDNDNVIDLSDRCPSVFGTFSQGCPDADGDGNAEGINDTCPGQRATRDIDNNGCQDFAQFGLDADLFWNTFFARTSLAVASGFVRSGVTITGLRVRGIPRGTKVKLTCSRRSICRSKTKRAGRRRRVSFRKQLKGERLRPGQRVAVRVSKSGYITRFISWKAKKRGKKGVTKRTRCARPGSRTRVRCSRVDVRR